MIEKNKGSITSFLVSYNTILSISTSVDFIFLAPKKIIALEKSLRICSTSCANLPRSLGYFVKSDFFFKANFSSITALKEGCANLPHSPLHITNIDIAIEVNYKIGCSQ